MATTSALASLLEYQPAVILDGGLATELEARGADIDDPLWSARLLIDQPDLIRQLHLDYFRAGADVGTSASYQASFAGFARRGLSADEAARLLRRSVELVLEARDDFWAEPANRRGRQRPLVAASIGPYGATLADGSEYRGDYGIDEAALIAFHEPRLAVLASAGADLLACETLPCLAEARALATVLRRFPSSAAWISFSCRDDGHSSQGDPIADCVREIESCPNVVAVGVNCTAPDLIQRLLEQMRPHTAKPLVAYPNAGETWDAQSRRWSGCTPRQALADLATGWLAAGARLIGGCCRTGPADIAALRRGLLGERSAR